MNNSEESFQEKLNEIRKSYAEKLPSKMIEIEEIWHSLTEDKWLPETLEVFHRHVHKLSGSGASFGFKTLSNISRNLDILLKPLVENKSSPTNEQRSQISAYLEAMKRASTEHEETREILDVNQYYSPGNPSSEIRDKTVYLADDEISLAQDLAHQIGYFGYKVRIFERLADLKDAII